MPHEVFVSYSQPDRDCALELVARLESAGIAAWIAPRDISPSADWAAEIIDAISSAQLMVLVFSSHSNQSPQVRREVERAVHKQLPVLPFRIEDVLPSKSLEYFLSAQHWMDAFCGPREAHYARLCAHLSKMLAATNAEAAVGAARASGAAGTVRASGAVGADRAVTDAQPTSVDNARSASHPFPATDLHALEKQLAHHIGPVAKVLIQRAVPKAADWTQLTHQLAAEVESEPERRQFIEACRSMSRLAR